ncbi:MAG: periplasmic heavy metal sensor [Rhodospirillaceae bacterium]|nr:periplasmic heavy metal sensor [Rhodospirillaceae bacterium]
MATQRTVTIFALVSLMLNVLLVGFIGAQWVRGVAGPPAWRIAQVMAGGGRPTPATVQKLRAIVEAELSAPDDSAAQMKTARKAVLDAMATEPFNAEGVAAALVQLRTANQSLLERFHRSVSRAAATMTPEERAEFAVFLSRIAPGGPGGGMFGTGPGGPPGFPGRPGGPPPG